MSNPIAYQNKDIISKVFTELFGEKSLNVYGLDLPKVVELLPTNLPTVEAHEQRLDNLLKLEDGSYAIVDYESVYDENDMLVYLSYCVKVLNRYGMNIRLRIVIIYTADVTRDEVKTVYENDGVSMKITPAFLSELDSAEIRQRVTDKIERGEPLTDSELMEFIVLPLTYKGKEKKQEAIREAISLAKRVPDEKTSVFLISGVVVFGDKVIDSETAEKAKEWIRMTKVGRAFELEKERAVEQAIARTKERTEAQKTVDHVESVAHGFQVSVEEACEKMRITKDDYDMAKELLASIAA